MFYLDLIVTTQESKNKPDFNGAQSIVLAGEYRAIDANGVGTSTVNWRLEINKLAGFNSAKAKLKIGK